jgi:signal peptide peptidase SppA
MRLLRVLSHFAATPWALQLETLQAMALVFERAAAEGRDIPFQADATIEARRAEADQSRAVAAGENVAVIPVHGIIAHRASMVEGACAQAGTSTELLEQMIAKAVADPSVRSIVLDVDSPGGAVSGVQEVADAIFRAREQKPIAAVANSTASSAAYWIASAAHEIFVTPSGIVGSIGVFMKHVDTSKADEAQGKVATVVKAGKYKAEGEGALTDEAREHLQGLVDAYYTQFVKAVARNRNVAVDAVRGGYGQGRSLTADAALAAGMVNGIKTLDQVISKYARRTTDTANRTKAQAEAEIQLLTAGAGPTT